MPRKKVLEDVVPPAERSIRNVSIKRERRGEIEAEHTVARASARSLREEAPRSMEDVSVQEPSSSDQHLFIERTQSEGASERGELPDALAASRGGYRRRNLSGRLVLWGFVVVALLFLIFSALLLFTGATVTVAVKERPVILEGEFEAKRKAVEVGSLPFETMKLERERERSVPAEETKQVDTKASGTIVIFNEFSEKGERLIKNTRFESPDGKVYRVDSSVVVPGFTKNNDGSIVPGSVEVVVYADYPGAEYNAGLMDFTIPGLKNDPRETKIYARSKTPMTGGFSGLQRVADEEAVRAVRDELQRELRDVVYADALAQVPEGFVFFDDAGALTFEALSTVEGEDDTVVVRERVTLVVALFNLNALSSFVAEQLISDYRGNPVIITNPDELEFSIKDKNTAALIHADTLTISLKGTPRIRWVLDAEALVEDLVGIEKSDADVVFKRYPAIESADVAIRPFWKGSFPERVARITITEENEVSRASGE